VKHNEPVRMDSKPIKRIYNRLHKTQKTAIFKVYETDDENPLLVDNCQHIMTLPIEFPSNSDDLECCCEFDFSDTTVRVFAYPASQPTARKEEKFEYEFY